jgi:hypothetical protein
MGSQGATCFHFLTNEVRDIPKAQWDNMRFGQICTNDPADDLGATFSDWKKTIEDLCSLHDNCDYQVRAAMELLNQKINALKSSSAYR